MPFIQYLPPSFFLSITESAPELDYVTAYIGCLSSDRADGLYTTVGTHTNTDFTILSSCHLIVFSSYHLVIETQCAMTMGFVWA